MSWFLAQLVVVVLVVGVGGSAFVCWFVYRTLTRP